LVRLNRLPVNARDERNRHRSDTFIRKHHNRRHTRNAHNRIQQRAILSERRVGSADYPP